MTSHPARSTAGSGYLNNRHYDSTTGVFTSVDPLVTKTMQPYIYGAANPVTFSDPDGLEACDIESGVCWDDYEDTERGNVYQRFRFLYRLLGTKPTAKYDKQSNTTRFENIPAPLQAELSEDASIAWDSAMTAELVNGGYLGLISGTQSHENGRLDVPGGVAVSGTLCLGPCLLLGFHNLRPYLTVGELGVGGSLDLHLTAEGSCAQQGWAQGGSYVNGVGGGASFSTPMPSGGGFWGAEPSNWDVSGSVGARIPFSLGGQGGTSYTWVSGC